MKNGFSAFHCYLLGTNFSKPNQATSKIQIQIQKQRFFDQNYKHVHAQLYIYCFKKIFYLFYLFYLYISLYITTQLNYIITLWCEIFFSLWLLQQLFFITNLHFFYIRKVYIKKFYVLHISLHREFLIYGFEFLFKKICKKLPVLIKCLFLKMIKFKFKLNLYKFESIISIRTARG